MARIAAVQRGLVTREQLIAAGVSRGAIARRVAQGRLHRVHRRVYLVGHPVPPVLARELAAVLACGSDALLSHRSAAALWTLIPSAPHEVDVTVPGRDARRHDGARVHRSRTLDPADATLRHGVPVTRPARTLVDLAEIATPRELEQALDEARRLGLVRDPQLHAFVSRLPTRRGAARLNALLARETGPALTRSEAEELLLRLVRAAQLPVPSVNARAAGHEVDFLWREQCLVVEVDGYAFHSSRASFERDRRRDADLHAIGLRVQRVTWRQLADEPEAVVARLAQSLVQRPA